MKVDIKDITDNMDRDSRLHFMSDELVAIKTAMETEYSCEHLELHFKSGSIIKIDVITAPMADTSFRYKSILK